MIIFVPSFLWTATIILLNIDLTGNKTVDFIFSAGKKLGAEHLKHTVLKNYFAFTLTNRYKSPIYRFSCFLDLQMA